ncbi:hypothetical protein ACFE04_003422 [Oxalis oulophora]
MIRTLSRIRTATSSPVYTIFSSQYSSKHKHENDINDDSIMNRDPTSPPKLFLVQPRLRPEVFLQAKLNEALCLANSLEEQRDGYFHTDFFDKPLPPHLVVQNPIARTGRTRADTFFGHGTVDTIKCNLRAADTKEEVDAVFVNAVLTGVQQRNLEREWGKPVLDRVGLIIEIFNAHAHTKEAKLQAELAALMYKKSRLVRVRGLDGRHTFGEFGEAEVVSARGRGSGGRGFISGAGETELQLQRRRIVERRNSLLSQIEDVRRTRTLQRAARKRQGELQGQSLATVAIVGYTNAGKSTLVSELTDTYLYSDDRLFATLDTRHKSVILPSGRKVLLSDTVGFISDLPIQLVEAFKSTLEEVVEADLLVHVIDCTAPNLDEHRSTVLQVLKQIGVADEKLQNMIEVWNKALPLFDILLGITQIDHNEEEANLEELVSEDENDEDTVVSDEEAIKLSNEEPADTQDDENPMDNRLEDLMMMKADDGNYSDSWLSGDDDVEDKDGIFKYWKALESGQIESANQWMLEKGSESQVDSQSKDEHAPDLKISAVTGVGLQELLELVDKRLEAQSEKPKNIGQHDIFHRKFRPVRSVDSSIAVEQ